MEVVDDQHHGPPRRDLGDDGGHSLEQPELGTGIEQHRTCRRAVAGLDQAAEFTVEPMPLKVGGQCVQDRGDCLHPRPHGRRPIS